MRTVPTARRGSAGRALRCGLHGLRGLRGLLGAAGAAAAVLASASTPPADGLVLRQSTTDAQALHWLERRESGRADPRFGTGGIVRLTGLHPQVVATDLRGQVYVAGQAAGDRRPVVLRLMPGGAADVTWGAGGMAFLPSAAQDRVTHLLPLGDGRLLVAGAQRHGQNDRAVVWEVEADGQSELPPIALTEAASSRVISMLPGAAQSVMIGLLVGRSSAATLEVHLHVPRRHGVAVPEAVARQPLPAGWSGDVVLQSGDGGWRWSDLGRPGTTSRRIQGVDDTEPPLWRRQSPPAVADGQVATRGAEAKEHGAADGVEATTEGPGSAIVPPMTTPLTVASDTRPPIRFQSHEAPWWERLPSWALAGMASLGVAGLALLVRRASPHR